jgi:hypothetical protein
LTADRCRSCQAPILWARTTRGKSVPLDAEPCADGNLTLVDGVAHYGALAGQRHYKSHFATCKQANAWRSER